MDAQELISIRKELGISQREFADRLGAGERTYQKWELAESPIRPMVARSVLNLVELMKHEARMKAAKSTLDKLEAMRQGLVEAIEGIRGLGGGERIAQCLLETLEKNKAPSRDEIAHLLSTVKSPVTLSALISDVMKVLVAEIYKQLGSDADGALDELRTMLKEHVQEERFEFLLNWAQEAYVMTSPDVIASVQKAILKNLNSEAK